MIRRLQPLISFFYGDWLRELVCSVWRRKCSMETSLPSFRAKRGLIKEKEQPSTWADVGTTRGMFLN